MAGSELFFDRLQKKYYKLNDKYWKLMEMDSRTRKFVVESSHFQELADHLILSAEILEIFSKNEKIKSESRRLSLVLYDMILELLEKPKPRERRNFLKYFFGSESKIEGKVPEEFSGQKNCLLYQKEKKWPSKNTTEISFAITFMIPMNCVNIMKMRKISHDMLVPNANDFDSNSDFYKNYK